MPEPIARSGFGSRNRPARFRLRPALKRVAGNRRHRSLFDLGKIRPPGTLLLLHPVIEVIEAGPKPESRRPEVKADRAATVRHLSRRRRMLQPAARHRRASSGTFIVIRPMKALALLDDLHAHNDGEPATPEEERRKVELWAASGLTEEEAFFKVEPEMTYVPKR
jgi:hypothetical protein